MSRLLRDLGTRLAMVTWLTVLWLVLWRDPSVANLASGVVVAFVAAAGFTPDLHQRSRHTLRPLALLVFLAYFAWKLVQANLYLAREVVTPRNRIRAGVVAVPLERSTDLVATVVASAVSLTPGTLTLEVRRQGETVVLYVHVLHLHDVEEAHREVLALDRRVRAAIDRHDPGRRRRPEEATP